MSFESFPYIVGWELTLACNLRCRHCGSTAALPRSDELTTREALNICDQLPDLLVQEVNFTGGEPLLRRDWQKIAGRLTRLGIKTKILSNGSNVDSEKIAQMVDAGISGLGVSLDGTEAVHQAIRGREGHFREILECLDEAIKADLPATVITTVNSLNVNELDDIYELLMSHGVKTWQVQPIFPLGRAGKSLSLILSEAEFIKMGEFVMAHSSQHKNDRLEILPGDSFGYFTKLDTRDPKWGGCSAGIISCGITSDGKIKGCLSLPDNLIEGDLRVNDFWDIWFKSDAFSYTRRFTMDKLGDFCRSCEKGEQCRGGCSAMSYGSTGRFNNDPLCFYSMQKNKKSVPSKEAGPRQA